MEYQLISGEFNQHETDCLVFALFNACELSDTGHEIDRISDGYLSKILSRGDIEGKLGQTLMLFDVPNMKATRLLLIGAGDSDKLDKRTFRKVAAAASNALKKGGITSAQNYLTELSIEGADTAWKVTQSVLTTEEALYSFQTLKSDKQPGARLAELAFAIEDNAEVDSIERQINFASATSAGTQYCRELGNLPPNVCTPSYLADQATELGKEFSSIKTSIYDEKDMQKRGMGALLAVAAGATQPAKLIVMEYNGGDKNDKPHVLVGKGITFDSGGISLKPPSAMMEMKFDMCGAASVFGTMRACAMFNLPLNVVAIVPSTENMPGSNATKPGDVVTSSSGKTIEILNTDAEGRLILCDALTYAERFEPEVVIDVATLTGAIIVALGHDLTGVFCEHPNLKTDLLNASEDSLDSAWQLPIWENYQNDLDTPYADVANIAGKPGAGSIIAACFLSKFADKFAWAHLDIAGTAWKSHGPDKGATGRPVPMLMQYLWDKAQANTQAQ